MLPLIKEACLDEVISRTDNGKVLDIKPFILYSNSSYLKNENIAYEAGIKLLKRKLLNLCDY
tara:strand:- start:4292 stop:4477 length:186 start_codon:yes stop_codon:yes gene_type:complete